MPYHLTRDDVFRGRVGVDAVRPLVDGDDVAALLVRVGRLARLVYEGAARQARHLERHPGEGTPSGDLLLPSYGVFFRWLGCLPLER